MMNGFNSITPHDIWKCPNCGMLCMDREVCPGCGYNPQDDDSEDE